MKVYGNNKATEFSRKQIGVIYSKAKAQELKVEKWIMSDLYDMADYYGYDDNGSVADAERRILAILDAVFAKDLEKAQELINDYTEYTWNLLSNKSKKNANRSLVA